MLFKPEYGGMWDPTVIFFKGSYYMISMHTASVAECKWNALYVAKSPDGVHWQDVGQTVIENDAICKPFALVLEDKVIVNCGAFSRREKTDNDMMLFYCTYDMVHFEKLGNTLIDERFYQRMGRWDHMYVVKDEKVFWGHIVATPLPSLKSAWGLQFSKDGENWQSVEPPVIKWGKFPHIKCLETGGCEKIGEYYYYIGGMAGYAHNYPYGMFAFRSKEPNGPFVPCSDFRLCGANSLEGRIFVQNLACFARSEDGKLLLSNAVDAGFPQNIWLLPMREIIVDKRKNIQLAYWKQNDLLKGTEEKAEVSIAFLSKKENWIGGYIKNTENELTIQTCFPESPQIDDSFAVAAFENLDVDKGVIIEGEFWAKPNQENCWRPTCVAFGADEGKQNFTVIGVEVGHAYKRESFVEALQSESLKRLDTIGEGCGGLKGVNQKKHTFRLLLRKNMMELYVDDMFVQTFVTMTGVALRPVIMVKNGRAKLSNLKIYDMEIA